MKINKYSKGQSLIELIIAVALFAIVILGLFLLIFDSYNASHLALEITKADFLAEEGLEAARSIRDNNFLDLSAGSHGLVVSSGHWIFQGTNENLSSELNGGIRSILIEDVGTDRKKISSTVSWDFTENRPEEIKLISYLTNWQKVVSLIGDWSKPIQETSINISGNNDGSKIQVQGNYAYIIINGGNPNFLIIDVSNSESPSVVGSLDLNGTPTNIAVSGDYAYLSNDDNNEELQIIDISIKSSPSVVRTYNAPGNANANGVYVSGTTVYLVRASSAQNEFLVINVAIPASPALLGSLDLSANGNEVVVSGNFAYVASGDNSQELKVINIMIPASPTPAGSLNLPSNTDATTIALAGSTVFIGQGSTFYTINVTTPRSPIQLGSFNVSGTLNDIALNLGNANTYVFIATSANSLEFQVINVSNPISPVLLGSVNTAGNDDLNGIAYDATLDRAFCVGARNTEEFIIIAPQ